ncbi:hypothetical protein [Winogradskyella sp. R77965]|uniref:hypothetical protein n=1 Tax=Winogradskyella sp. R77965 TaxID=3093872 RepID=UPI0037DCE572
MKNIILKYGIPILAIVVIIIHLFFVNIHNLNKWKGGGYGMYSEMHYYYNQIYIPDMSVDSLVTDNDMKNSLGFLMLMPNKNNLKRSAELVLKSTKKDSIHMQIWRPIVNSKNGVYSRELVNEIYLKNQEE